MARKADLEHCPHNLNSWNRLLITLEGNEGLQGVGEGWGEGGYVCPWSELQNPSFCILTEEEAMLL